MRDGAFVRPRAIGAYDGEVYVIDTTGRVQVFSESGEFLRLWNLPAYENGTPTAITFTQDGAALIPDTHYSRILAYSKAGELLDQWGAYGSEPGQFIYPTDIARDDAGNYYISEYGQNAERIQVFDAQQRFVRQWGSLGEGPGQFNRAMALELAPELGLFVADTANHRIQHFTLDGAFVRAMGDAETLKFPHDLARAPDGSLLAAAYGSNSIAHFTPAGEALGAYGAPGRGPGQLNAPRGVAVSPEGRVFVADTDNHRVQSFLLEAAP